MPNLATVTSTFVRMANRPSGLRFFQVRRRTTMCHLEFPSAMREARKNCFETKPLVAPHWLRLWPQLHTRPKLSAAAPTRGFRPEAPDSDGPGVGPAFGSMESAQRDL